MFESRKAFIDKIVFFFSFQWLPQFFICLYSVAYVDSLKQIFSILPDSEDLNPSFWQTCLSRLRWTHKSRLILIVPHRAQVQGKILRPSPWRYPQIEARIGMVGGDGYCLGTLGASGMGSNLVLSNCKCQWVDYGSSMMRVYREGQRLYPSH